MPTFIRLTDYKSSDAKEAAFFDPANRYKADQNDFEKIPGSPIAYWVKKKIVQAFQFQKVSEVCETRLGMATADNNKFLRLWGEVDIQNIGRNYECREDSKASGAHWFPYQKGGEFRKWYGNHEYVVNWKDDGIEIMNFTDAKTGKIRSHNYNLDFIFKRAITWNALSSTVTSMRISENSLFDNAGSSMFVNDDKNFLTILSFMNTKIMPDFIKAISPTLNYQPGDIASLPIIYPKSEQSKKAVDILAQQNIDISKEEWDSRETSWDFTRNELLKHKSDNTLENALNAYSTYWSDKFNTLHTNEEELNRLFIDIYGLQDELTPDVELKDITILKTESKIINGKLDFQKDEIIEQFISYAVGCMFGRYSLDREGLILANQGDTLEDYLERIGTTLTFEIDDDNIIPIVDEADYFSDDITDRFTEFVKTTFGPEKLQQNIAYIENALGKKIRVYFTKDFYIDHTKRYNKRPIYWLFSSPKGSFQMLVYMHRYTPDTLNHILNDYLRPFRIRLDSMRNESMRLTERVDSSAKEKADADKKIDKIDKTLHDINEYEKVLAHYAAQRIAIDLDDGVKVNYCKFKELLYEFDKKFCK